MIHSLEPRQKHNEAHYLYRGRFMQKCRSCLVTCVLYLFIFIYLYNFANEQTAHYIHKYRQLAGYTLQLAPITAALYINMIQQTIKLITTRASW